MTDAFIAGERTHFLVAVLCCMLRVAPSWFYAACHADQRPARDAPRQQLLHIDTDNRCPYGHPRLHAAMRQREAEIGHKRVVRWLAERTIRGRWKGRRRPGRCRQTVTSPAAPNLRQRPFAVSHPQPAWVADITYLPTRQG